MQFECRVTTYRQAKSPVGDVFTIDAATEAEAGETAKCLAQAKYGTGGHAVRGIKPRTAGWTVERFPSSGISDVMGPALSVPLRRWRVKVCFAPGNPDPRVLSIDAPDEDAAAQIALEQLKTEAMGRTPRIMGVAADEVSVEGAQKQPILPDAISTPVRPRKRSSKSAKRR